MKFKFTQDMLKNILTHNKETEEWHSLMEEMLPTYEIDTPQRVAGFLAQCAHESNDFTVLSENLNYSENGLKDVFGKYFRDRAPSAYARNPEAIANVVYADRMGNGSEKTGEGWKFRGRGVIQLTGKNNYIAFGKDVGRDEDQVIKYLETKKGALESACWFWNSRSLNDVADAGDIKLMTKKINGGYNGLEDREKHYKTALSVLGAKPSSAKPAPVKKAAPTTKDIQKFLGLEADGIAGPKTLAAIKEFQKANDLTADGIAGKNTLKAMFGA